MDAPEPTDAGRQVLLSLWQALRAWRGRIVLATVLLVLSKLAAVGVPGLLKAIVDRLTPGPGGIGAGLAVPVGLLLGYALLRYASTLFTELRDLVFSRVGKQVTSTFSERAFAHLLGMSPRFHAQRHTGALIRDVERGVGGVGYLLGAGLFTVVPTAVEFLAVLVIIVGAYGLKFVIVIATAMVTYSAWTGWKTRDRVHDQRRMNTHDSQAHALLVDTLLNYEAVKTHGHEAAERRRYADVLAQWVEGSVKSQRTLSALHLGQAAIIAVAVGVVMVMAGMDAAAGRMSVGDLVLINAYLIQVFLPLNTLGFVFRETRDALLNTETLFQLLREVPEIDEAPDARPLAGSDMTVRFEHVDFGYEPRRPLMHDFSLEIPHGRTVAVVGSSGSGKSTLARLLLRLYDPAAGQVSIGGQPLTTLTQHSLRQTIGVVPQDPMLFNDTIAYNIAYGRPGATQEEVQAAAQAARIHGFIAGTPQGYATPVGERGLKLSGGEKQRVAIARTLLKDPPILIFDEATSALDSANERAIQAELKSAAEGKTTLLIAHRLSTVVDAHEILVMDAGQIVERGTHAELLARGGRYASMWALQQSHGEIAG